MLMNRLIRKLDLVLLDLHSLDIFVLSSILQEVYNLFNQVLHLPTSQLVVNVLLQQLQQIKVREPHPLIFVETFTILQAKPRFIPPTAYLKTPNNPTTVSSVVSIAVMSVSIVQNKDKMSIYVQIVIMKHDSHHLYIQEIS
jgi:hypothetical protein